MSKSLDRVLQPDGSYKWQETELIHSGKVAEPVVEPEPKEVVVIEEPIVENIEDAISALKQNVIDTLIIDKFVCKDKFI